MCTILAECFKFCQKARVLIVSFNSEYDPSWNLSLNLNKKAFSKIQLPSIKSLHIENFDGTKKSKEWVMFLLDLLKPTLTSFHCLNGLYETYFLQFHQMLIHYNLEYLNLIDFNRYIYKMAKKCVNVKELHIAGDYYEE